MTAVNPYPVDYRPAFASFHLLHPPGRGLALRLGFRLLRGLTGLLSFALLSNRERIRQFLSPGGRVGVSSRFSNVSTGRIPFWVKRGLSGTGLQHLPLVSIDEVYQNFTYVCHLVPA